MGERERKMGENIFPGENRKPPLSILRFSSCLTIPISLYLLRLHLVSFLLLALFPAPLFQSVPFSATFLRHHGKFFERLSSRPQGGRGGGPFNPSPFLFCESVFLPPPPSDLFLVSRGDETRPFEQAVLVEQTPRSRERRRRRRKATIQISR